MRINSSLLSEKYLFPKVLRIQKSLLVASTTQAKSPSLIVALDGHRFTATVDEGSELNCINSRLAQKCSLETIETKNQARAADSSRLRLVGQLKKPLFLVAEPHRTPIRLQAVVVVDQINADILIGEPGKRDNGIVTYPIEREIKIPFRNETHVYGYSKTRGPVSHVARVPESVVTYPGENYFWPVPEMYSDIKNLQVQPRVKGRKWFESNVCQIQQGKICLRNVSTSPVFLHRGQVFADIMLVEISDLSPDETDQLHICSEMVGPGQMIPIEWPSNDKLIENNNVQRFSIWTNERRQVLSLSLNI